MKSQTMYEIHNLTKSFGKQLIAVKNVSIKVGKGEKVESLYNYVTSDQFRQKIETIVETYVAMRTALDQERRAMQKIWFVREKQIERLSNNTVQIYGEMQGIAGPALGSIDALEIGNGKSGEKDSESPKLL